MAVADEWGAVMAASARLQEVLPDAVLVGGTAAAHHAAHRISLDDDHVVADLRARFDQVLEALEATDGCMTRRVQRPVQIHGALDGVPTGIRQLRRSTLLPDQLGPDGDRVATQLVKQLADPHPYDLDDVDLRSYRRLLPRWQEWSSVVAVCREVATTALARHASGGGETGSGGEA